MPYNTTLKLPSNLQLQKRRPWTVQPTALKIHQRNPTLEYNNNWNGPQHCHQNLSKSKYQHKWWLWHHPKPTRPHGNPCQNDRGLKFQDIMRKLNLRAASTFFDSNGRHNTWISPSLVMPFQLDHILIPKHQLNRGKDVKRKMDGTPSDHDALMIKI